MVLNELLLWHAFSGDQLGDGDLQDLGQRLQRGDIRRAQASLPFADGSVGDVELIGQFLLCYISFFAKLSDESACLGGVHGMLVSSCLLDGDFIMLCFAVYVSFPEVIVRHISGKCYKLVVELVKNAVFWVSEWILP